MEVFIHLMQIDGPHLRVNHFPPAALKFIYSWNPDTAGRHVIGATIQLDGGPDEGLKASQKEDRISSKDSIWGYTEVG